MPRILCRRCRRNRRTSTLLAFHLTSVAAVGLLASCGGTVPTVAGHSTTASAAAPTLAQPPASRALAPHPGDATLTRIAKDLTRDDHAWRRLATLCDRHGHRLSGSRSLEAAIDWAVAELRTAGFANARREDVDVPKWVRGAESAEIVAPQIAGQPVPLVMLGLGNSVGTPASGVTAEVVIAHNDAELKALGDRVRGRIVLFNNPMPQWTKAHGACYGKTVRYRVRGATMAAKLGAVAVLVRSVTAHSLRSPHTGMLYYGKDAAKIPAAALSTEDADRVERLVRGGQTVRVRLRMAAKQVGQTKSANVVAELRGRERPEEIVIVSGHIDSWDVGQGAHDDGAGVIMAMETLLTLKRLGLRPRRTIRVVLWTNEENGMAGVRSYLKRHAAELPHHIAAIEADAGGFAPVRWGVSVKDPAQQASVVATVRGFLPRLRRAAAVVGPMTVEAGYSAPDVGAFRRHGVPSFGLHTYGEHYFDYHHTAADTVDKVNPQELGRSAAAMATLAWYLAERAERLSTPQR